MKRKIPFIKIYLNQSDKRRIAQEARECGMSQSRYARTLVTGGKPVSRLQLADIDKVMKIHADLGRLGGLLKMTLTNDERLNDMGREMGVATIDGALVDIRATSAKLLAIIDIMLKKAKG